MSVKILIILRKGGGWMEEKERLKIVVDRDKEMRTKEISKMISEGGLGPTEYYDIKKVDAQEDEQREESDE